MQETAANNIAEQQLIDDIAGFSQDPLGFVYYAYPWGEGELADFDGPDQWQIDILSDIRDGVISVQEALDRVRKYATASGHGIDKSALVAWLIQWSLATYEDTRVTVTANTDTQLRTKTWPELAKWHRLFIAKHWFRYSATSYVSTDPEHEKTWRADAIPWSASNPAAFAGLHNKGKRLVLIFDEASEIADVIWDVAQGAMTDESTEIFWFAFGNPTQNSGMFYECFNKFRARWNTRQIDSRTVKITNNDPKIMTLDTITGLKKTNIFLTASDDSRDIKRIICTSYRPDGTPSDSGSFNPTGTGTSYSLSLSVNIETVFPGTHTVKCSVTDSVSQDAQDTTTVQVQ